MGNDSGTLILLIVLIVSAFLLIVLKLAQFVNHFSREKQYLLTEMHRAADYNEYRYWRRELRCLYLCLIPFVTERNVMKVYPVFFHRAKHAEKNRSDGLSNLLAPSVIGACICTVCLCGASWAWFTASTSTGTAKIQAAAYTVSVTATQGETPLTPIEENGSAVFTLEANKEYQIEIKPTGNATTGYCKVNFEGTDYYTVQLPSGTLLFTVYASENGSLTVTPEWGTCAIEGQKIGNGEGNLKEIGTQAALPNASDDTSESTDTEPQPTTPANTTSAKEIASTPDTEELPMDAAPTEESSPDATTASTVQETTIPTTEQTQSEPEGTAPDTVPTETSIIPETTE